MKAKLSLFIKALLFPDNSTSISHFSFSKWEIIQHIASFGKHDKCKKGGLESD
ncbi:hypothetical protein RRR_00070 [Rickettsia rickettsii str. R]|nr:hypothetical protein RRR_00070 [Rickettsia rickettsii str. R]